MESIEPTPSATSRPTAARSALRDRLRDATIVLQAEGAVSRLHGLGWLTAKRDAATLERLSALQVEAMTAGWSQADFARARLDCLRPRRTEILALRRAYMDALAPDAERAAHRLRRAGYVLELSGEVAVEALLGVADALGITPDAVHAPRLRFDAIGSYTGCETTGRSGTGAADAGRAARVYVGTRQSELLADAGRDVFVRYTGVVAHEGPSRGESVASFDELAALLA